MHPLPPRPGRRLLGAAAIMPFVLALAYWGLASYSHERLDFAPQQAGGPSQHQVRVEARPVVTVEDNLSGLTFDRERGHLWAVVNNPEELLALGMDGELLQRYPLSGFKDVEGVTWLGDGLLVFAEEHHNTLVIVPAPDRPGPVFRGAHRALTLPVPGGDNQGIEGLGYDRRGDRLFIVKEHSPRGLLEIRGLKKSLAGDLNLQIIDRSDWIPSRRYAADLSSVAYDEHTGNLLLLSHESRAIIELDGAGRLLHVHSLSRGSAGLRETVAQAEGMAFTEQGDLVVVSEPNLFHVFSRNRGRSTSAPSNKTGASGR
jgi:uncharacterized protein YjiK